MSGTTRTSADLDPRRRRTLFRAWHRASARWTSSWAASPMRDRHPDGGGTHGLRGADRGARPRPVPLAHRRGPDAERTTTLRSIAASRRSTSTTRRSTKQVRVGTPTLHAARLFAGSQVFDAEPVSTFANPAEGGQPPPWGVARGRGGAALHSTVTGTRGNDPDRDRLGRGSTKTVRISSLHKRDFSMPPQFWLWLGFAGMAAGAAARSCSSRSGGRPPRRGGRHHPRHRADHRGLLLPRHGDRTGQPRPAAGSRRGRGARQFYFARYIDWTFTTPLLLVGPRPHRDAFGDAPAGRGLGAGRVDLIMIVTPWPSACRRPPG